MVIILWVNICCLFFKDIEIVLEKKLLLDTDHFIIAALLSLKTSDKFTVHSSVYHGRRHSDSEGFASSELVNVDCKSNFHALNRTAHSRNYVFLWGARMTWEHGY